MRPIERFEKEALGARVVFQDSVTKIVSSLKMKMDSEIAGEFDFDVMIDNSDGLIHITTDNLFVSVYDDDIIVDIPKKDSVKDSDNIEIIQKEVNIIKKYLPNLSDLATQLKAFCLISGVSAMKFIED